MVTCGFVTEHGTIWAVQPTSPYRSKKRGRRRRYSVVQPGSNPCRQSPACCAAHAAVHTRILRGGSDGRCAMAWLSPRRRWVCCGDRRSLSLAWTTRWAAPSSLVRRHACAGVTATSDMVLHRLCSHSLAACGFVAAPYPPMHMVGMCDISVGFHVFSGKVFTSGFDKHHRLLDKVGWHARICISY